MIKLKNIHVTFTQKKKDIQAVKDVSLSIQKGDVYGIVGFSGAGKSTLVRTINLLQPPTSGEVIVDGKQLQTLSPAALRAERKKIGMIFQHFNLMKTATIFENVAFPLKGSQLSASEKRQKVNDLLALVGLSDKSKAYPSQLSGGQKQRVAIARALANDPKVLLCDEATSALDPQTTLSILNLLKELNQKLSLTIVLITHEMQVVKEVCNKVAVMENGRVVEQGDILSIFSRPKSPVTQSFINTATHVDQALDTILAHESLVAIREKDILAKITYIGAPTSEPLVAHLYSQFGVTTNILSGDIEIIQETPIGNLIVVFSGEQKQLEQALVYLLEKEVQVTQIPHHKTDSKENVYGTID